MGEGEHRDGGARRPTRTLYKTRSPLGTTSLGCNHIGSKRVSTTNTNRIGGKGGVVMEGLPGQAPFVGCHAKSGPPSEPYPWAATISGEGGGLGRLRPSQDAVQNGVSPRNHHGIRAPSNVSTQTVSAYESVGPGERDAAFGRVNEYPRHRRGSKRKTILTWAAALLGHQEANRHPSWCMVEDSHKGVGRVARDRDRMTPTA
ncbi:hypothetical protein EDB85DRAFT_1891602 [Lactarius pseudohatsudake]|nr:hypothetical protein EDB85DRAFT_1891602 [Lactarius pseudohatsudake]